MKVVHLIGGGDVGGAKIHVLSLVKELSKYINVKIISFRPGAFTDEARSMGIDIEVVKTGNIIGDIRKVIAIVREGNFEIVHSHGSKANMLAVLTKRFLKLPTVTTVHSDYKLDYLQSASRRFSFGTINTVALRFINYYIGVSNNFAKMLIERKFDPEKIFTVYNGIDFSKNIQEYSRDHFTGKYNLTLDNKDIIVGILARMHPVKGLNIFIQAAKEVIESCPNVKFLIGGDGDQRKALEHQIKELGLTSHILLLGWVKDPYELMSNIDINILSSLSESFPYVILEGAKLKKATVSSDVGGISDLITSGENGYLFKPGDYKRLAEYIIELVKDETMRKEMGEKLYEKANSLFSLENMCKTQLSIYKKISENRNV